MNPRAARFLPGAAAALVLIAHAGTPSLGAEQGSQKIAFVTVVADATGPRKDLTAKDFVAYEDNSRREVVAAERSGDPLSVFLIVDTSAAPAGEPGSTTQDLRTALTAFVKTLRLSGGDVDIAFCPTSNAAVTAVDFGKRVELDTAVGRIAPEQASTSVIVEALADAGKALKNRPAPRRAIVSVDFNSPEGSADKALKIAAQSVHDSGATVWAVSVRGQGQASQQSALNSNVNRETVLNELTTANGGARWTVRDSSGLQGALVIVANTLASQYAVTFAHPGGNAKKTRFETTGGAKVLLSPFMR